MFEFLGFFIGLVSIMLGTAIFEFVMNKYLLNKKKEYKDNYKVK